MARGSRRNDEALLRRGHPRLAGDVPEVPGGRGLLRGRCPRVRRRPDGQGPRADRSKQRRVPRQLPGPRRGVRAGRAGAVHARRRAAGLLLEGLRARRVRGRRGRSAREARSVPRARVGEARRVDRAGRGSTARNRRSALHDRRERRRAGGAGDPGSARRRARRRERGAPDRSGRRAHDDHGRPLDLHAVGHAAGGERGGDRAGRSRRPQRRCPTSAGACSTCTAPRRTPRSTRA